MKIKALVSFAGAFSMHAGQVAECTDEATLQDLLNAGYIEEVTEAKTVTEPEEVMEPKTEPKKGVKSDDKQGK